MNLTMIRLNNAIASLYGRPFPNVVKPLKHVENLSKAEVADDGFHVAISSRFDGFVRLLLLLLLLLLLSLDGSIDAKLQLR